MKKRVAKKLYKKFDNYEVSAYRNCFYYSNCGLGCANGHSAIYPRNKDDYLYDCKEKHDVSNFLAKLLAKEGYSLSGWKLNEIPTAHEYIFYNKKKHKEVAVTYITETSNFILGTYDMFWKYSKVNNVHRHNTIKEALMAPWQHWNHVMEVKFR